MFKAKKWKTLAEKEKKRKERNAQRNKGKNNYPKVRFTDERWGNKLISFRQCWHECPLCHKPHCHDIEPNQWGSLLDSYFLPCKECLSNGRQASVGTSRLPTIRIEEDSLEA